MRKWLLLAALLLPMLWLGGTALLNERALGHAREWRIPIEGYDPRDPLRGQYVRFTYAWAIEGDPQTCQKGACAICLSDQDGSVVATVATAGANCRFRVDPAASNIDIRPAFAPGGGVQFGSRIFVSEARAPEIEEQLRQGPMVVVAALTPDGRLVNRRIEPAQQSRPIPAP
jgi:hypothetical protein